MVNSAEYGLGVALNIKAQIKLYKNNLLKIMYALEYLQKNLQINLLKISKSNQNNLSISSIY